MIQSEIITIGDEILIGQIVDTNSAWIGAKFSEIGIPVKRITSIGDREDEIFNELSSALVRSDVVIVTGGLGPTKDDITKKTIAKIFDCDMHRDMDTYNHVKNMMEQRGIEFNISNQCQADVPDAAKVLKNEFGTAPGMMFQKEGHLLFSLPGVPFEMKELISRSVIKEIISHFTLKRTIHKTILTYGIAESVLSELISNWEDNLPEDFYLAYLPGPTGIKLRLSAYGMKDANSTLTRINFEFDKLHKIIGINYLGDEGSSLVTAIGEILRSKKQNLFVAESCTGGKISEYITSISGASDFFLGSITSYTKIIKENILKVPKETIQEYSVVSQEVVKAMAKNAMEISGADYTIATTGNAGPSLDLGTKDDVGTVWIAVAEKDTGTVTAHKIMLGKLRTENIARATSQALFMLYAILNGRRDFRANTTFLH